MIEVGYSLSSEETSPQDLIRYAKRAEESGFSFALISDHYHPWIKHQGQSPFVWSVIGGIFSGDPDQEGFFRFYEREILPKLRS
jgi:coenzyme F420-dependent glucose-6-phosphate dehydrogenase